MDLLFVRTCTPLPQTVRRVTNMHVTVMLTVDVTVTLLWAAEEGVYSCIHTAGVRQIQRCAATAAVYRRDRNYDPGSPETKTQQLIILRQDFIDATVYLSLYVTSRNRLFPSLKDLDVVCSETFKLQAPLQLVSFLFLLTSSTLKCYG